MVLYLDAVWLLNLLIDASLLQLTALMLKRRTNRIRFWLGAFTASSIVLILFTPLAFLVDHPLGKFLFSLFIIFVTFGFRRLSVFVQNLAAFYFLAFGIGGGLFALHYFFQSDSFYANSRFLTTLNYGDPISWIVIVTGFPFLWFFSKKRIDQTVVRKWQSSTGAELIIQMHNLTIKAKAIIDSGNKLYEPLTRFPVMFLSRDACKDALPSALFQTASDPESMLIREDLPDDLKNRLALIPFMAVDGSRQFTAAIRPDQVLIMHEGKLIECRKVYVALTEHTLSSSGDFDSILHPDMLLHGKVIEPAS
ncbi:sigma-E processing peptidase SpoIIGA [Sporolactobacillus putidus]|uniref:Sporulation sigma-E factor-processing peptidase n=1 Tax=Sporolactobacillus putidus TaxID=492735 RepID=A0A917RYQ0_9BACL|nr:sigma-E processing peptidase SpoIIGA [Sporolactobacillus putidus]GGL44716.1 sporulation sigma-E factor-processing peptidase [Sporolactobacillus putidus]